ncbi:MAG: ABC transporter substrate-binding protein [Alphaproteobacteria bacterium]
MKRRSVNYVAFVLLPLWLVSLLIVVFSLPSALRAQEKPSLRIVFVSLSWNNQLPFRIAVAKGFFKDQGLSVEPIFVRGGPTAIAALVSADVDFASVGGAQAPIRSNARGLDVHIIASQSNFVNYTLLGNKETKTIEDLRGKTIGITGAGAFSDFAMRVFLKRNNLDPDKDVTLRAIGGTVVRAVALEKGAIAAAPFSAEDAVRLLDKGYSMIVNLNEVLRIPQSVFVTRGEVLEKYPETTKRFLKAIILGMQFAKNHKQDAIKAGFAAGLKGEPDIVNRSYDLFIPGYTLDLSVAHDGIQLMLDEDIRNGVVDPKMTLDRVVNDRLLKQAQQELRSEGRLKP